MNIDIFYTLLSILILILIVYNWKRRHLYIASFKLEGPISFPIIGNGYKFFGHSKEDLLPKFLGILKSKTDTSRMWLGPLLLISIKSANDIEKLLSSKKLTQKLDIIYNLLKSSFGYGLIASSGEIHQNSHRLIQPTLHPTVIETYIQVFQQHGESLVECLRENVGRGTFNVLRKVNLCMIKVVLETVLDIKTSPEITDELLNALIRFRDIFYTRVSRPWMHVESLFKLTSLAKDEEETTNFFRGFIRNVIRMKNMELSMNSDDLEYTSNSKRKSTLYFLLRKIKENPNVMSEEQLVEDISTLFLAAEDTTHVQLCFSILMLGMHPHLQEKIYEEIQQVLGESTSFTISDLNQLCYLEMFLKEGLRLLPIPMTARKVTEDFQFENFVAPKGCYVVINVYELHRHPKYWEKPNEFYPEHFTPENVAKRHPSAWIPFSGGPRRCLGGKYAINLLKTIIINLLRSYKVEADGTLQDLIITGDMACRIKGGYPIRLKYRK